MLIHQMIYCFACSAPLSFARCCLFEFRVLGAIFACTFKICQLGSVYRAPKRSDDYRRSKAATHCHLSGKIPCSWCYFRSTLSLIGSGEVALVYIFTKFLNYDFLSKNLIFELKRTPDCSPKHSSCYACAAIFRLEVLILGLSFGSLAGELCSNEMIFVQSSHLAQNCAKCAYLLAISLKILLVWSFHVDLCL